MDDENTAMEDVSHKKLTEWEQEPSLQELKQDLTDAQSSHDTQSAKIRNWLDNLHVEGQAKPKERKGSSSIQPKLIKKQAEWRYSPLSEPFLSDDDLFDVHPMTANDVDSARQNQILLNQQINTRIDRVRFIDDYVQAAVEEGTAIVKVGWEFEEEEYEAQEPVVEYVPDPSLAPMYRHLDQLEAEDPQAYEQEVKQPHLKQAHQMTREQGIPIRANVTGFETVTRTRTLKNQPTLEVCHYDDVYVDPSAMGDTEAVQFVVHRFQSSLAELRADGKYVNLDKVSLQDNNILGEPDNGPDNAGGFNFSDKPRQKFTVHEYWGYRDIDGSGVVRPIVAAWVGDTLIRLEENPFPDGRPPFVLVPYRPRRRSLYGEPDADLLEDNQKIVGAVTRGMVDIMGKSANGQTGMKKGMLDVTNRRRFEQGKDYEFNPGYDPQHSIHMHTFSEIPASAQIMLQMQNQEAESLTGVKAFSSGISGHDLGENVPAVRGVLDASSKREMSILRRLENGMIKIGRKLIAMNAVFLDEEEVVRVTEKEFVPIRRDDLAGNFDLRLTISSAEADEAKAKELSFMLQTVGNSLDMSFTRMILADIARLRKMPKLAQRIEEWEPQPDPHQQRMSELELALKEAEVAKAQAEAEEVRADAQLKLAKAAEAYSQADLKNLDYVEQESGVKQERDLQKVERQAESQAEMKRIEHQLKASEESSANA